jgi:hypothetical protein
LFNFKVVNINFIPQIPMAPKHKKLAAAHATAARLQQIAHNNAAKDSEDTDIKNPTLVDLTGLLHSHT